MRRRSVHNVTAIALCIFLSSLTAEAQDPGTRAATPQPALVGGDPGSWRRDPFIDNMTKGSEPATAKGSTLKNNAEFPVTDQRQDIQLQGIIKTDRKFHALINGRSVKAGDRIGNITIKQISRYQVVLLNERKEKLIYDIYQGRIDRGKK